VSVQAQVINLMQDLQEEFGLSYLFIAHDLSVVRHISNRIAVMYLGHIVEMGDAETIYKDPRHPYSRALLASAPRPDPGVRRDRQGRLPGDIPSPINKPSGCPFRTRCPIARPACADAVPALELRGERFVACPYSD
jgi:oligopeptide/dipeptide ABC transporter ATP-binding protein